MHRRSARRLGVIAAILPGVLGVSVLTSNSAHATAPTSVVLSQATGIQDNQVIQVSGTGTAGESLVVTECGNYNVGTNTYNATAGNCVGFGNAGESVQGIIVDINGNWGPVNLTIRRQWTNAQSGATLACRERNLTTPSAACGVRVTSLAGGATQVDFHMAPKMTVTPSTGLRDGDTVTVSVIDMPSSASTLGGGFTECPTNATFNAGAGRGTTGDPLNFTATGLSPTGWITDYCAKSTSSSGSPLNVPQGIGTAVAADGSVTYNYTVHSTVWPSSGQVSHCNPGETCRIIGFATPPNWNNSSYAAISFATVPTATISSVTGQTVTSHARPTNTINLSGVNWNVDGPATVELCDSLGANCDSALSGASVSSGALSGGVTVPSGATTGLRSLKITSGADTASTAITILGAPSVTASPNSSGVGTSVTVTGSNWNPGSSVSVTFADASDGSLGTAVVATATGSGGISATLTVPSGAVTQVRATDAANSLSASTPFTPLSNSIDCGGTSTLSNCSLVQNLSEQVNGGNFSVSQAGAALAFPAVTLNGSNQTVNGSLNDLTVIDARGSYAGWTLTATATDFSATGGLTIAKSNLAATPSCSATTTGSASPVTGTASQAFSGTVTLCTVTSGGAGGTFAADAGLALTVPASAGAGNYAATITLLAV